jgi:hypothetical protein
MTRKNHQRKYVLEIHGTIADENSNLGSFIKELMRLTGFTPGNCFGSEWSQLIKYPGSNFIYGYGVSHFTDFGEEKLDGREGVRLITDDSLNALEKLLKEHDVKHIKNPKFYELCCEETTKEAKGLYFHNYHGEKLLFITSPTKLFSVSVNAFVANHCEKDDLLERELVSTWLEVDADSNYDGPPTTLMLMSSLEAAKKWIEDDIYASLKRATEDSWGEKLVGAYLSGNNKYRYPKDLTDEQIATGPVVLLSMSKGEVIKTYSDGVTLMDRQSSIDGKSPLNNYFDCKKGFEQFQVTGCERCCAKQYRILKNKLLEHAVEKFENDEFNLLMGPTSVKIDYNFNIARVRVSVRGRKKYSVYQPNIAV